MREELSLNEAKGSKYWIREAVNENNGEKLTEKIGEKDKRIDSIKWISPLKEDNYREYMINAPILLENLNQNGIMLKKEDLSFWPQRQPQWDSIGVATLKETGEKMIVLVESKGNIKDLKSKISSKNEANRKQILEIMKNTYDELGIKGDFEKWYNGYYQIANRITFMHQLTKLGFNVKVVFLNFVEDHLDKNITKKEWIDEYCKVLNEIIGERFVPKNIVIIDLDVNEIK